MNFYSVDREKLLKDGWDVFRDLHRDVGDSRDFLHIGKSSYGWCFALRIHPGHGIFDLGSWAPWLVDESRVILDEYGRAIDFIDLYEKITDRRRLADPTTGSLPEKDDEWYHTNYAVIGPNGLARHTLGHGCVGHGDGTYDLIEGVFS